MAGLHETENIPVMLACEDEFVAVSMKLLVEESTVFKSMFSSNWREPDASMVHPFREVSFFLNLTILDR